MELKLEPVWPLWVVIPTIAGLLALVLLTYPQRLRHLKPWDRRLLLGLRLAGVALLALAMLRPYVLLPKTEGETRFLYIIADRSRSMKIPDGAGRSGGNTRRQELVKTIEDAQDAFEKLGKNVEIRYFDFSARLTPTEKLEEKADGSETDIAGALQELLRQTDGKRVLGVILLSDGTPRVAGADPDVNQRQRAITAARDFGESGIPIHTVPFGSSGTTKSAADLAAVSVNVDTNPYEGKVVTVNAVFRAVGAQGKRLTARILVEDRTGVRPGNAGRMVEARPIKFSKPKDNNIHPKGKDVAFNTELSFVPTRPGQYKISVEIRGLQRERNLANNSITRIINVRSGGISVAYFDRLRPEQKYIRKVNSSDKIQLDFFPYVRASRLRPASKVDPEVFQPGENAYDVFIIGDVPAAAFSAENLRQLRQRIDDGAGFLMTGGYDSFGPGGYAGTPLADVLPVEMHRREKNTRDRDRNSDALHHKRDLQMLPTDPGLARIVMRIAPIGENEEAWKKLPTLHHANKLKKKLNPDGSDQNLVETFAVADGNKSVPLLITNETGGKRKPGNKGNKQQGRLARVMAFAADTTYLWYLGGHQAAHQRFWRQIILYLAQTDEEDRPVWVRIDEAGKRVFSPRDSIPILFGARDENGDPVNDLEYQIEVLGPPKKDGPNDRHRYQFKTSGGTGENARKLKANAVPGEYWIRVTGRKKDGKLFGSGWDRFLVKSTDLELDNPAVDRKLLESIAEQSGGTFVSKPQGFAAFAKRLAIPRDELIGIDRVTLWDTWPRFDEDGDSYIPGLLLLFVALMSVEWFLRKRKGLV